MESDSCNWCGLVPETDIHLLVECPEIKDFWEEVYMVMESYTSETLDKSTSAKIFNQVHPTQVNVCNFIALVAKQYIYSCKCLKRQLSICEFDYKLNLLKSMEKYIAIKNNCLSKFNKKWQEK